MRKSSFRRLWPNQVDHDLVAELGVKLAVGGVPVTNFFFASSPYNVLLSGSLADEARSEKNILFVRPAFSDASGLIEALRKGPDSPFSEVIILPVTGKNDSPLACRAVVKENRRTVSRFVECLKPKRIFVSNDFFPEAQHMLLKGKNIGAKCAYVEDGIAAYTEVQAPPIPNYQRAKDKLLYGFQYAQRPYLGAHPSFERAMVLFPDFVRSHLRQMEVRQLSKKALQRLGTREWFSAYAQALGVSSGILDRYDGVCLLPSGDKYNLKALTKVVEHVETSGLSFAYKHHSKRWTGPPISGIEDRLLPADIPMELIFLRAKNKIRFLLGANSSALISARFLEASENIVSLSPILGFTNPTLRAMFQALGMEPTDDLDGLAAILAS